MTHLSFLTGLALLTLSSVSALAAPAPRRLVAECGAGSITLYAAEAGFEAEVDRAGGALRFSGLRNYTIAGEEVHFEGPGFHLEVITNLDAWSVGSLPGTDVRNPSAAEGHAWIPATAANGIPVDCTFH